MGLSDTLSSIIQDTGAIAMSWDDIPDSLPGVAIANPLVPPLYVVGISLSEFQWSAAFGAMELFLTNFLSILLVGGGILALLELRNIKDTLEKSI